MKAILNHLFEQKTFSRSESKEILTNISLGKYNTSQMAAFMTAYCMRSITVDELQGFKEAMIELCVPIELNKEFNLIDLCGTGGDGKDTFNISTLASFIVAGAGYHVAKHGNYGVSSGCGSSNVMEYLGYHFTNNESDLKKSLDQTPLKGLPSSNSLTFSKVPISVKRCNFLFATISIFHKNKISNVLST